MNVESIKANVDTLYRWDWRNGQGSYVAFSSEQNISIETSFRMQMWGARLKVSMNQFGVMLTGGRGQECTLVIDFDDMTVGAVGLAWATVVRRWNRDKPMGEHWDHQESNVHLVRMEETWHDYNMVLKLLFDRPRADGAALRVSRHTHRVVCVRRVQNRGQLRLFEAMKQTLEEMRGTQRVSASQVYAWHGSGKTPPIKIAMGKASLTLTYGAGQGYYKQGCYTAHHASFCHSARYIFRSSDVEGLQYDDKGKYFHLLLVKLQRGEPLREAGQIRESPVERLGEEYDSIEGGPHRPNAAGPGADDSLLYVVYQQSQCLPEFVVTYEELE